MAADRTLVAGAAAIANAQTNLDTAGIQGASILGERMGDAANKIIAQINATEAAENEIYGDNSAVIKDLQEKDDLEGDGFSTTFRDMAKDELSKPTNYLNESLKTLGYNNNFMALMQNDDEFSQITKESEKNVSVLKNYDNVFKTGRATKVGIDKGEFVRSYLIDSKHPDFNIGMQGMASNFEIKRSGLNDDKIKFNYSGSIDGVNYPLDRIADGVNYVTQLGDPTIQGKFNNQMRQEFKSAKNNAQADQITENSIASYATTKDLENIVTNVYGQNIRVFRDLAEKSNIKAKITWNEAGVMNENADYKDFLQGQLRAKLNDIRSAHYEAPTVDDAPTLTPNKLYDINQDKLDLEKFNAYLDTVTLGRGGMRSGFQKPTLEGWVNSKAGIKLLSKGGFSLAKIEYEEGPPDISLVNDANGRKSKLEPEMLKTRDMDYIKNVMRALKKLN